MQMLRNIMKIYEENGDDLECARCNNVGFDKVEGVTLCLP